MIEQFSGAGRMFTQEWICLYLFPRVQVPLGNLEPVLLGTIFSPFPIRRQQALVLILSQSILLKVQFVKQGDQLKPVQIFIFSSSKPLADHQEQLTNGCVCNHYPGASGGQLLKGPDVLLILRVFLPSQSCLACLGMSSVDCSKSQHL